MTKLCSTKIKAHRYAARNGPARPGSGLLPAFGPAAPPRPPGRTASDRPPNPEAKCPLAPNVSQSPNDRRRRPWAPPTPGPPSDSPATMQQAGRSTVRHCHRSRIRRTTTEPRRGQGQTRALPPARTRRRDEPARPTTAPQPEVCCRESTRSQLISEAFDGNADGNRG
jgi:hypothetical protein